jgi:hypothetical protein
MRMLLTTHSFDKDLLYRYVISLSAEATIAKILKGRSIMINYDQYGNILGMTIFLSMQTVTMVFSQSTNIILLLKFSKLRASQRQGASL